MKSSFRKGILCSGIAMGLLVAYQNFTYSNEVSLTPGYAAISTITQISGAETSAPLRTTEATAQKTHHAKYTGEGLMPVVKSDRSVYKNPYFDFSIDNKTGAVGPLNDRSEIRLINSNVEFGVAQQNNSEFYYTAFKFMIPKESDPIDIDQWALIWQCAQVAYSPAKISPPLALQVRGDELFVVTQQTFTSSQQSRYETPVAKINRGEWYSVTLRYKLGQSGSYAIWINGVQVSLLKAKPVVYRPIGYQNVYSNAEGTQRSCRASFGLYKQATKGSYSVYFSDMYIGTAYKRIR